MLNQSFPITRCVFESARFGSFGEVRFCRSETDGEPVMAIALGEREAQLPLTGVRREFGIEQDSADGRMLELIGCALHYVPAVSPGDRLPSEVLTGEASWRPNQKHIRLATTRLRLNLVAWLTPRSAWAGAERDEITLLRLADDDALIDEVRSLAIPAAQRLDMSTPTEVLRLMEEMSMEVAYIEALRERLLGRVERLCRRMAEILSARRGKLVAPSDTLAQVHRLTLRACEQLRERFDDVDAQTGEPGSLLRNTGNQRQFIRTNRDWLYRNQRIWDPLLASWDESPEAAEEITALLAKTYQFLAPRFMPTKLWQSGKQDKAARRAGSGTEARAQMSW